MAFKVLSGTAAVLLFATGSAVFGDGDTYQSSSRSPGRNTTAVRVNDWWWPFGRSEIRAAHAARLPKADTPAVANPAATGQAVPNAVPNAVPSNEFRTMTPKEAARLSQQAMEVYTRRLEVCDRIKQAAEETGDTALMNQAEVLQKRAWVLCQQRLDQIRMPGLLPDKEADAEAVLMADKKRTTTKVEAQKAPVRSIRGDSSVSREKE